MNCNWYKRASKRQLLEHGNVNISWREEDEVFLGDGVLKNAAGYYEVSINPETFMIRVEVETPVESEEIEVELKLPWETARFTAKFDFNDSRGWSIYTGMTESSLQDLARIEGLLRNTSPWPEIKIWAYRYENRPYRYKNRLSLDDSPAVERRTRRKRWK